MRKEPRYARRLPDSGDAGSRRIRSSPPAGPGDPPSAATSRISKGPADSRASIRMRPRTDRATRVPPSREPTADGGSAPMSITSAFPGSTMESSAPSASFTVIPGPPGRRVARGAVLSPLGAASRRPSQRTWRAMKPTRSARQILQPALYLVTIRGGRVLWRPGGSAADAAPGHVEIVSLRARPAPARGLHDEPALDEERLVDVLDGALLLADGHRDGLEAHGVGCLEEDREYGAVHAIEPVLVDAEPVEALRHVGAAQDEPAVERRRLAAPAPVLADVADAAQEAVRVARGAAAAPGEEEGGLFIERAAQDPRGALENDED